MARFPTDPDIPDRLLSRYESLTTFEKRVLQLISVIYEPTTSEIIMACMTDPDLGPLPAPAGGGDTPSLSAVLRRFQDRELITWRYQCHPVLVERLSRQAVAEGVFASMAGVVRKYLPVRGTAYDSLPQKSGRHLREMRIGLYLGDFQHFNEHLFLYSDCPETTDQFSPLVEIINTPFDRDWFRQLPAHLQIHGLQEICQKSHPDLAPVDLPLAYLLDDDIFDIIPEAGWPSLYYLRIVNLLLRGDLDRAETNARKAGDLIDTFGLKGWLSFLHDRNSEAVDAFREDLALLRERREDKNAYFIGPEGLIHILALLKMGDYNTFSSIVSYISAFETSQPNNPLLPAYRILYKVVKTKLENFKNIQSSAFWNPGEKNCFTALFMALGNFWLSNQLGVQQGNELASFCERAMQNGYNWLAMEYGALLSETGYFRDFRPMSDDYCRKRGVRPLHRVLSPEQTWQRALKALNFISTGEEAEIAPKFRMIWLVDYRDGFITIHPREQKMTAQGKWTQGRAVSLKRLFAGDNLDFLSSHDQKIQATLHRQQSRQGVHYEFDMDETLPALIGHPHLFLSKSLHVPVEFIKGEPEIRADRFGDQLHLTFHPPIGDEKIMAIRETPTRFKVIKISAKHRKIHAIIGDDGLSIPFQAREQVLHTLGNLSVCMTIHSDIGGTLGGIEEIRASAKIIIQLLPVGTGFRLSMLVRPFEASGPYLYPGQGMETVIAEIDGKRLQARRHLEEERENCAGIEQRCPTLARLGGSDGEWLIDDPQDCLEVLHELEDLGDEVRVEWPEGERLTIRHQVSFENFRLSVQKKQNWFEMSGELALDENEVMDMKKLLDLIHTTSGRFIPLEKGQFLALSREFRKQLDELDSFSEQAGRSIRIHPLAGCALEEFTESGIIFETDLEWQEQLTRIRDSRNLSPQLPATLQAELRDYQKEGFTWLARLCHWGVGACLADDMGLGKTIQALAIILQQARFGPSLVVAPTSVCQNWIEETNRFAPTLQPVLFGGRERQQLLEELGPFHLLVCSYGLLQQEAALLASRDWQVIILDEAQAIKNLATKRSRAAMTLSGRFKMITTGTPIENHLGELWNLFNFINPGLLGSLDHFNRTFAAPIEKDKDPQAKRRLKKLIHPFILRRLKSQVLEELPPRTEVVLKVDMSDRERSFYEALRQQAIEKIERSADQSGQRHMQILAEIMRLRRACCSPSLVHPHSAIASSKLELFGTIIDELVENRHKALVFSQFVGHLEIIRTYLDKRKIVYQYLDGSTPARQRHERVTAFQSGVGDLFLISLKAGGLGLNLTAADYVIHMDPWWNPAVEDQASDRAHRIGQRHPVTVYRLVTSNTIEEKIVKLHQEKKDLANSLLEGSDMSHRINADDLLKLLKET